VRGLWLRSDTYYVQLVVDCQTKRIALQAAQMVSEAVSARQVLKDKISNGSYQAETSKKLAPKLAPADDRSLTAAISGYQSTRNKLGGVKPATGKREDSGLKAWGRFAAARKLTRLDDIDTEECLNFAEWRRDVEWATFKANSRPAER
jgi:hypothetical protein